MKLGTRIFFCYILIFIFCFYYPMNWSWGNLRTRYLEGVEDPLVDQANIMAALIGDEMETGLFDAARLYKAFHYAYERNISARIYKILKTRVDIRIYITDAAGKIIFDSEDRSNVGKDYSKWRDVKLTLQGDYGARSSKNDDTDPESSVLYVAAPILVNDQIAGVLTVAKPTTNINSFLKEAKPQILKIVSLSAVAAILISYIVAIWLTLPIKRLTSYAMDIGTGVRAPFPQLGGGEIGEMGKAFLKMQEALEGKKYVEKYIHTLTHEIKSPISAIRGASELLREKMPHDQRERFLSNIHNEVGRIQDIVDRMLELSALETKKIIQKKESISLSAMVKTVLESIQILLLNKHLIVENTVPDDIIIQGDSFLLHQAVSNLVQNAVDFSPVNGKIVLAANITGKCLTFSVKDDGKGVPDFAMEKIFDKFFSLHRPDSGKKSTGLGLNLVKEVALLHNGNVKLENHPQGGAVARLVIPIVHP
ncbi:two-component system sensor histidine kinase CreC [Thermodesulfobacteriota bacterium]